MTTQFNNPINFYDTIGPNTVTIDLLGASGSTASVGSLEYNSVINFIRCTRTQYC